MFLLKQNMKVINWQFVGILRIFDRAESQQEGAVLFTIGVMRALVASQMLSEKIYFGQE